MTGPSTSRRHWVEVGAALGTGTTVAGVALGIDALTGLPAAIATGNARTLLAAAFSSLVTAGAFAFWMLPLAAQLASASVPPPTVAAHLHDTFQRRIIVGTIGALAYTGIVLLSLPSDGGADAPAVSTSLGALLGVAAIISLLVAVRHAEQSTRPGVLVNESAETVVEGIRRAATRGRPGEVVEEEGTVDGTEVEIVAPSTGWLHAVDEEGLLRSAPSGTTVRLQVGVGAFLVEDWTVVATIQGAIEADDGGLRRGLANRFRVGNQRAAEMDLVGSLSRFTDIGVHAATGGSGAPSTVYETLWYLGAVVHELIRHDLGVADRRFSDGRVLERKKDPSSAELVDLAVDRIRQVTASHAAMALELVRVLVDASGAARTEGRDDVEDVLHRQADLAVAQCRHAEPLPEDLERVVEARANLRRQTTSASRDDEHPAPLSDG